MDWPTIIAGTSAFISVTGGVVTWEARAHRMAQALESRITGHDQLFDEREKLAAERHEDVKNRLTRIESKLDASNGRH
jgi:hypothetical protein